MTDRELTEWLRITKRSLRSGLAISQFADEVREMQKVVAELTRREVRRMNIKKRVR
jgi:hypothetical protein